ncbi:PREDICTED: apoptosis regulator R1-like [Priapulus caudatus]|uniref:Apoptosis regulator R1-like n=1 Tax=Priapulus caudatus TaxID=37621 RepID=A0ABM1F937_PRICU|nr:PREDICTED: apoptosis regulator R1-like [Priapulus caudatus]
MALGSRNRRMVMDYVAYRLERAHLDWVTRPILPSPDTPCTFMRTIADEFRERSKDRINDDMAERMHLVDSDSAQAVCGYCGVLNDLFEQEVKWGWIVGMFAFTGTLCECAAKRGKPELIDAFVDAASSYCDTNLQPWIDDNGGWDGFVEYYKDKSRWGEIKWPSMTGIICGAAAVTAVGVATMALLSRT